MPNPRSPKTISVREAAVIVGVTGQTIHRLLDAGLLKGYKKTEGRTSAYAIYYDSLRAYVKKIQGRDI